MELMFLPIGTVSLITICLIIGILAISIFKKWMMTYALIITNFFVFIPTILYQNEIILGLSNSGLVGSLAFKPMYLSIEYSPQLYTLFTSMFIHSGPLHIFGNMLIFFFVGMPFEQRIGWKKFLVIYLLSGICGTLAHSMLNLGSPIPLVGASGAIFGILGAFAYSYPRDEVVMPIPLGIIMVLRKVKVIYAVLIFAVLETVIVLFGVEDSTAHFAHLGGLVGGVILAAITLRSKETRKTTDPTKTIYYDSFSPQKAKVLDISSLEKLAHTPELKSMLNRIETETVPQVRDVWLEHFLEKTQCPECQNKLVHFDGKIWCDKCGFISKY